MTTSTSIHPCGSALRVEVEDGRRIGRIRGGEQPCTDGVVYHDTAVWLRRD